ncbi:hypothetical protein SL617_11665, partial [Klebsiella michiganensis]
MSKSAVIVDRSRQGRQRKKRWLSMLRDNGWRVLLVVVIVAFWQFGVSIGLVNAFLMGSPAGIWLEFVRLVREGANKQVISSQADSLIKISRIWAD